jgi:hypothetical protein
MPNEILENEFDPEFLANKEAEGNAVEEKVQGDAIETLRRRRWAYQEVFSTKSTDQEALDIVLLDLAQFCRGFSPTLDITDGVNAQLLMNVKEGRREVFRRVLDFTQLDEGQLYYKYHAN